MSIGPVQILVIGFAGGDFHGQIQEELDRLREEGAVRVLDILFVRKDADGNVTRLQGGDLPRGTAAEPGVLAASLVGIDGDEWGGAAEQAPADGSTAPDDEWYVDDYLPNDTAAALVLIEHRWAIGLRDAIRDAGGFHLADSWVHPLDLLAVNAISPEDAEELSSFTARPV